MTQPPSLRCTPEGVELSGCWTLAMMLPSLARLQGEVAAASGEVWDLTAVSRLDSAAAVLLWRAWGCRWPARLHVSAIQRRALARVAELPAAMPVPPRPRFSPTVWLGELALRFAENLHGMVALFGQFCLDLLDLLRHPREMPWREFSAYLYKAGAQAMPVTALVGFLIGITLSYLSALQLRNFGADLFIVNLLGISIIRELGPVLVAVLVAGRSGSAMTAQIGVMRVTEEIDALATMGVPRSLRLVLPKLLGLTVAMPLIVLWTSAIALLGGMLAARLQLDLSMIFFFEHLPRVVPMANLVIGLGKGLVFGFIIALVACHFGLRVKPNTESLSANTTRAVVTAITAVILCDAIFAVLTRKVGIPQL